jgi:hypothetical protein
MRLDRDLPESFVHTGFAPRRAPVRATEKVPHRLSEIPQRLLLHSLRARRQPLVLGARGGQLRALLAPTTDTTQKGEAAFPAPAKAMGFHAATNR